MEPAGPWPRGYSLQATSYSYGLPFYSVQRKKASVSVPF